MSTQQWGDLTNDTPQRAPLHNPDRSTSSSRRRAEDRELGQWSEDLETSIYGECDYTIPGMGKRPESCGRWYPESFCDDGHVNLGVSRCQNRSCPDCYPIYSRKRSEKVARRLGAARYAAEEAADKRAVHAVVSTPEGSIETKKQFYDAHRAAYELAKEKGIRGGVLVPHGWRVLEDVKSEYREEDPDGGVWRYIRENDRHWRDQVYFSPHFHIIGLARYDELGQNDPENDDGWVFKRIRTLESFTLRDEAGYNDMIGTTRYILSHATYEEAESKQVLRWFGELAPAAFSPEEALSEGALSVLERKCEEVAGSGLAPDEATGSGEDVDECDREGCECELNPIWEAGEALQNKNFCKSIGEAREAELRAAFRWAIGEALPPPGLKNPRTKADAEEALRTLL